MNILEETKGQINKFVQDETFSMCGIPSLIDKDPSLVNNIMIDQSFNSVGPYGTERVSRLKKAFKVIVEDVLPINFKIILKCLNEKTDPEMIQIARDSLNRSRNDSKYNLKETEKLTVEDLISFPNYTKGFINTWHTHLPLVRKSLFEIKDQVREIVRIRNRLFKNLKGMHNYLNESFATHSKYDFAELARISTKAQGQPIISTYSIYGLKRVKSSLYDEDREYESNCELSE